MSLLGWKKAGTTPIQTVGDTTSSTNNTGPLPVQLVDGAGGAAVGGSAAAPLYVQTRPTVLQPTVTLTRQANTDAYAAKDALADAVPNALSFANAVAAAAGKGRITGALLSTSDTTNTARIRLHLYAALPTVISADNAAFVLDADDDAAYLGYIDFPPPQVEGTGTERAVAQASYAYLPIRCAATTLFARPEVLDAIATSVTAATFRFLLEVEQVG